MHTKENHEKPYYSYRAERYFIVALIAGGIVTIALAFIFTAWLSILYLVLGLVLLSSGVFWLQLVVSSFAFHEIKVPDRTVILKEAVRVLVPGGVFVICGSFSGSLLKTYIKKLDYRRNFGRKNLFRVLRRFLTFLGSIPQNLTLFGFLSQTEYF